MQTEGDRDRGPSGLPGSHVPMAETDSAATDVRIQLAVLVTRLTAVESDLAALKTGMSIVETRLTGIESRQRHAERRGERIESRFSDFDFGVDRAHSDLASLKDRMRCVELDLRELAGALCRGAGHGDTLRSPRRTLSHPVGFKSS